MENFHHMFGVRESISEVITDGSTNEHEPIIILSDDENPTSVSQGLQDQDDIVSVRSRTPLSPAYSTDSDVEVLGVYSSWIRETNTIQRVDRMRKNLNVIHKCFDRIADNASIHPSAVMRASRLIRQTARELNKIATEPELNRVPSAGPTSAVPSRQRTRTPPNNMRPLSPSIMRPPSPSSPSLLRVPPPSNLATTTARPVIPFHTYTNQKENEEVRSARSIVSTDGSARRQRLHRNHPYSRTAIIDTLSRALRSPQRPPSPRLSSSQQSRPSSGVSSSPQLLPSLRVPSPLPRLSSSQRLLPWPELPSSPQQPPSHRLSSSKQSPPSSGVSSSPQLLPSLRLPSPLPRLSSSQRLLPWPELPSSPQQPPSHRLSNSQQSRPLPGLSSSPELLSSPERSDSPESLSPPPPSSYPSRADDASRQHGWPQGPRHHRLY